MSTPVFKRISLEQFGQLLTRFPFTREVNAVHMHHTWRPSRHDFRGHETIVSMWRFHTRDQGWRDIAQHITIDPEGFIWLGRNWNLPPVSASGHNGNSRFGPFMFEMIGNFDHGFDPFDGPQRETTLEVVAQVQARFNLPADSLKFHNAMSTKSCPGNGVDFAQILAEVEARRNARSRSPRKSRDVPAGPFPDEPDHVLHEMIEALSRDPLQATEPGDAELSHDEPSPLEVFSAQPLAGADGRAAARDSGLDAGVLAALRPHVVNLTLGRLSDRGESSTSPADVDAIFDQSLPRALEAANAEGRKLRLLFYAHGGLVSESSGLRTAARHIEWWKRNGVYPIYFIWETGLFETIGQLLARAQQGATRGLPRDLWDFTLDPIIEVTARALQGPRIWAGMKASAEHSVDAPTGSDPIGGGARYVARKLKAFCDAHPEQIELHAAGHSAGSILHSHFLCTTHELGVPTFASAHFLAPAVRVDAFKELLAERVGPGKAVHRLTLFTMQKDFEKDDHCAHVYHKSLLYLVSNALESERSTPLLGLEESLRADAGLKQLFGLGSGDSAAGEVVWSVTPADSGTAASAARSHGDFDDDPPTMNSLARRVLGKADADAIIEYGTARGAARTPRAWVDEVDWPERLGWPSATPSAPGPLVQPAAPIWTPAPAPAHAVLHPQAGATPNGQIAGAAGIATGEGRRQALCIGIDRYPDPKHELAGCVADARMWSDALTRLGFSTKVLTDRQATREAIASELMALVSASRVGDVIVFQYAGHGTHLPDLNGDEEDQEDEALCPVDFASGALYIDDDIAQVIGALPDGVNMTCFMDCCHSGTNSRFAVGAPTGRPGSARDERKRFVAPTTELIAAHRRFRQQPGYATRAASAGTGGRSRMRDIKFAACLDGEVAWESDGHGEFTLRATRVLTTATDGMTNEQFARQVTADFGHGARQHPMLDCADGVASAPFLRPIIRSASVGAVPNGASTGTDDALLLQTLSSIQHLVERLAAR